MMIDDRFEQTPPPDIGAVPWSVEDLRAATPEFAALYAARPLRDNLGGMAFNHCFAAWYVLRALKPSIIVESGVFQGQGTWLIEQASPGSQIICLDVTFDALKWRSQKATYLEKDFAQVDWSKYDLSDAVALFDDHQNAYRRVKEMNWVGLRRAIFEDNFPVGEGDSYSVRHILAGVGHAHIQVSKRYRRLKNMLRDGILERYLNKLSYNQTILVQPNAEDRANLLNRLRVYHEIPPAFLPSAHRAWRAAYEGKYASKPPLLGSSPEGFDGAYSFICYLEIG